MQTHDWEDLKNQLTLRRAELTRVIVDGEQVVQDQLRGDAEDGARIDFNHPADAVSGDPDYEKEINIVTRQRAELALVDHALSRIKIGTYGTCEDCSGEIELTRLKAVPYTKYCLECQAQDESLAGPVNAPREVAVPGGQL